MIVREWRMRAAPDREAKAAAYLDRTGVADAEATPGNRGALLVRRPTADGLVEFTLLTFWDSMESIREFAGEDPERAVRYPADDLYFEGIDLEVSHHEVVDVPPLEQEVDASG